MGKKIQDMQKKQCPCWSSDRNGECAITEGGVYIPLHQHIMVFCQSSNFIHCTRYISGRELVMNKEILERRKFRRYEKNFNIAIDVCDAKDSSSVMSNYKVRTLDVSLYGMKIESPEKIPADTIVGFQLDPDISSEFLAGSGSVKWCRPQTDSGKFEFGLAFYDDPSIHQGIRKLLCQ